MVYFVRKHHEIMLVLLIFLYYCLLATGTHFKGSSIRWVPVDPYTSWGSVVVSITQSYWWTYPFITCANDTPASTPGRATSVTNLTCISDCLTSGGYSAAPITILTDCASASSFLGSLISERTVNVSLAADSHFYVSYQGTAWQALNYPSQANLAWSISSFIDLRMRPDGFINTPPVTNIISPQFVIVNKTTKIEIPISDVNTGDDLRCRWASNSVVNECGGICFPSNVPSGTTLSNCTITFKGTISNTWYGLTVQVRLGKYF